MLSHLEIDDANIGTKGLYPDLKTDDSYCLMYMAHLYICTVDYENEIILVNNNNDRLSEYCILFDYFRATVVQTNAFHLHGNIA